MDASATRALLLLVLRSINTRNSRNARRARVIKYVNFTLSLQQCNRTDVLFYPNHAN